MLFSKMKYREFGSQLPASYLEILLFVRPGILIDDAVAILTSETRCLMIAGVPTRQRRTTNRITFASRPFTIDRRPQDRIDHEHHHLHLQTSNIKLSMSLLLDSHCVDAECLASMCHCGRYSFLQCSIRR